MDWTGWMPVRTFPADTGLRLKWWHLGNKRFVEPFFSETVNKYSPHPELGVHEMDSSMETLLEWSSASPGIAPSGFIFHMSRCGSTLVSRMLATLPENIVISEADPIDGILCSHFRHPAITEDQRIAWLRALLSAYGQKRHPAEKHLFVKFDSWHTPLLPLIRRAFPDVPWIFIFRNPVEVLVSLKQLPGWQVVPGRLDPGLFGWTREEVAAMPFQDYAPRVLAKVCEAALAHANDGKGRLVHYPELPGIVCPELMRHWNIEIPAGAAQKMATVVPFHAKRPSYAFANDSDAKKQAATDSIRESSARWLDGLYAQLKAKSSI